MSFIINPHIAGCPSIKIAIMNDNFKHCSSSEFLENITKGNWFVSLDNKDVHYFDDNGNWVQIANLEIDYSDIYFDWNDVQIESLENY